MIHEGALPLGQQIALDLIGPPVITGIWWILARGWAGLMGTTNSDVVRGWQKPALWIVLIGCYFIMFGITIGAYFF